jgi:hypothetical protein
MSETLDTFDIELDTVGAEAVQQTLDALGLKAEEVNAAASGHETAAPGASDWSPLLDALHLQTSILARIADLLENRPVHPNPTY